MKWIVNLFLDRIPHYFVCDDCDWVGLDRGVTADGRRKARGDARRHRLWGCRPDLEWIGRNIDRFDLLGMRRLVRQRPVMGLPVTVRPVIAESELAK